MPDLILILSQPLLPFLENAAFLQVLTFFLLWIAAWLPLAIPIAFAVKWQPGKPITVQQKLPLLASLYLIAPLILGAISGPQRWSFVAYGLQWTPKLLISLGIGLTLGLLGLWVLFGSQRAMNWIQWELPQVASLRAALLPTLGLGLGVGFIEELIFRGFLLNQFQQVFSGWIAAAIASLIFAVLHLVWEGPGGIPQLPGLWLMGMVLTLARWVDGGSLGLAWGLHAGWVCGIASVDSAQLITYTGRSPQWMTGLDQKPLAGVMGLLFLSGTGAILFSCASPVIKFSEAAFSLGG